MGLHWSEKETLRAQYPEVWLDVLLEAIELVDAAGERRLTPHEAAARAKSRFSELMLEHQPECQAQVAAYQERIRTEQAERNKVAAEYEEKRVRAMRTETLRIEQEAQAAQQERYQSALEAEQRFREETLRIHEQEEVMRRERDERERLSAEESAKEAERLLGVIEKG